MEKANKNGVMDHFILENGNRIKLTEEEYYTMLMEINTRENGQTIKLMVKEYIRMLMEQSMREIG